MALALLRVELLLLALLWRKLWLSMLWMDVHDRRLDRLGPICAVRVPGIPASRLVRFITQAVV